jgi:hypothetical protein
MKTFILLTAAVSFCASSALAGALGGLLGTSSGQASSAPAANTPASAPAGTEDYALTGYINDERIVTSHLQAARRTLERAGYKIIDARLRAVDESELNLIHYYNNPKKFDLAFRGPKDKTVSTYYGNAGYDTEERAAYKLERAKIALERLGCLILDTKISVIPRSNYTTPYYKFNMKYLSPSVNGAPVRPTGHSFKTIDCDQAGRALAASGRVVLEAGFDDLVCGVSYLGREGDHFGTTRGEEFSNTDAVAADISARKSAMTKRGWIVLGADIEDRFGRAPYIGTVSYLCNGENCY